MDVFFFGINHPRQTLASVDEVFCVSMYVYASVICASVCMCECSYPCMCICFGVFFCAFSFVSLLPEIIYFS